MSTQAILATSLAQGMMAAHYGERPIGPPGRVATVMRVDGKWGTYTQFAYDGLPMNVKTAVDAALRTFNTTSKELANTRALERSKDKPVTQEVVAGLKRYYDFGAVQAAVRRAVNDLDARAFLVRAKVSDPDAVIAVIQGKDILDLEAARGPDGSYDAFSQAKTSSAAGLWQFIANTWNRTVLALRARGVRQDFTTITQAEAKARVLRAGGPFDLSAAAYAYVWLTLQNAVALSRAGLPISTATLYTLHQQGEEVGVRFLQGVGGLTAASNQSSRSLAVLASARNSSKPA